MMYSPENLNSTNTVPQKPIRPAWRGLVLQLFTIVILPLSVLLIITTFAGLAVHQQTMRDLAAERDKLTVQTAANALGELIQQRISIIHSLAVNINAGTSLSELEGSLVNAALILDDTDTSLAYFDSHGNLLASVGDVSPWEHIPSVELISLYKDASPGTPSHHLFSSQDEKDSVIVVAEPSADLSLIASLAFSPDDLILRSIGGVVDKSARSVYVITPELQVLFNIGNGDLAAPLVNHLGVEQAHFGQTGATYMNQGADEHIVTYSPVEPFGWALVIEEPWDTVASRKLRLTENAPLVLIPIIVLALLALWFSSRYIVRPLQALEMRAAELGWGDFQAIEDSVGGIEEIRNLQGELIHLSRKVQAAQKGLHDYIGAITLGQEEERLRLARELHDDTLQSLIALNQRLQLVQMAMEESPQTQQQAEMLTQLQDLAAQTMQDLRRMTRALRPAYLEELGLVAALEMLAREVDQAVPMLVGFQRVGIENRLAPEVELALFRIAQEALNNVVKHAQASHASLSVAFSSASIRLEVHDDGVGFDVPESPAAFAPSGHFGLLGLHERAEMIGAQLKISSIAGEGSQITIEVPFTPEESIREENS